MLFTSKFKHIEIKIITINSITVYTLTLDLLKFFKYMQVHTIFNYNTKCI